MQLYSDQIYEPDPEELIKLWKICCIGCIIAFRYGYFVYFDYLDVTQKLYNGIFIRNRCPDINIMTPIYLMRNYLIKLSIMYAEIMIIPWMNNKVHIVAKLSGIHVWNRKIQEKEEMLFARWYVETVLDYCDYSILCKVISKLA